MQVKIESCTRDLRPLRGQPNSPLHTGVKVGGNWFYIAGDHRNLYGKVVDLEFDGNIARFANPQTTPTAQQPPPPPPPPSTNGHKPCWSSRESVTDAYIFYATEISKYLQDPLAVARAANCLIVLESKGDVNPVHRVKE